MRADVEGEPRTGDASVPANPRAHLTVRARILTAVVALAGLTVLIAGGTAYGLQVRQIDARIDNSLARAVAALRAVEDAAGASTDHPTMDLNALLKESVRTRVPGRNEGVVTLLDDRLAWQTAPETQALPLGEDEELFTYLATRWFGPHPEPRTLRTSTAEYRFVAVPVHVSHSPGRGLFVVAFDRGAEMRALKDTYVSYVEVGIAALALTTVVAWFVVGRLLRPVRLLRDTARRVTESDLSERIDVSGKDDLSDLARTVNAMLDRLQLAFGSQRELLDDVGHELRTPLTIVRGHLELMDADDPADVRATQALTLDELDRMHRLVDDLMTLATADRPDFVRLAPTDVGQLTDDVHDKARVLGNRHWVVVARADVTVQLDAQRVTQAWLQLLANAHRFTAPGTVIRLGSEVAGDRLLLWVRDEGPGVPAEEEEHVFERFHRGQADRNPHGAGLGLPIVAAIARAHHGRVFLEHPPPHAGPGAVFVLDLPAVDLVDGDTPSVPQLVENR